MAVEAPRRVVEKRPVDQLGQAPVQIVGPHPPIEPKANDLFVEKQLLALHLLSTNTGSATATVGTVERRPQLSFLKHGVRLGRRVPTADGLPSAPSRRSLSPSVKHHALDHGVHPGAQPQRVHAGGQSAGFHDPAGAGGGPGGAPPAPAGRATRPRGERCRPQGALRPRSPRALGWGRGPRRGGGRPPGKRPRKSPCSAAPPRCCRRSGPRRRPAARPRSRRPAPRKEAGFPRWGRRSRRQTCPRLIPAAPQPYSSCSWPPPGPGARPRSRRPAPRPRGCCPRWGRWTGRQMRPRFGPAAPRPCSARC